MFYYNTTFIHYLDSRGRCEDSRSKHIYKKRAQLTPSFSDSHRPIIMSSWFYLLGMFAISPYPPLLPLDQVPFNRPSPGLQLWPALWSHKRFHSTLVCVTTAKKQIWAGHSLHYVQLFGDSINVCGYNLDFFFPSVFSLSFFFFFPIRIGILLWASLLQARCVAGLSVFLLLVV